VNTGWFTLGGAVVGGIVSLITAFLVLHSNRRIEEKKQTLEDARRYNLERAEAYSKFLSLANNLPNLVGEANFAKARDEMWQAYIKTHLLSSEHTRVEARKVFEFALDYMNAPGDAERRVILEKARKEDLTKLFIRAAQEQLRITEIPI
jgi:uncharacterized membrane protein YgaE (UPF0421/DUF939 family)